MKKGSVPREGGVTAATPATGVTAPPAGGIRVGIGGWVYAPWRGVFYPGGLVQRRELEYASRHVTAIEINGTYYGVQKPATYAKWRDQTPPGFVFSAKAPRRIVQSRRMAATGRQVEDFIGGIAALGDCLGPLLWQFDGEVPLAREQLAAFLERLPRQWEGRRLRHVLEVRDPGLATADVIALAREHGVATVYTDSDVYPNFADVSAGFVYARLMRSRASLATGYPRKALDAWAERARCWSRGGEPEDLPHLSPRPAQAAAQRDVFVFFIGAAKQRNPAAAMALIERIGAHLG